MKRKLLSALVALTALAFASCSMDSESESDKGKGTYITLSLNEANRMALPVVDGADAFDRFTLTGTSTAENATSVPETSWTSDSTSTAYAKMTAASIAVTAGASYSFTLTGEKGGATWQGTAEKTIKTGANSLSFTLALATISTEGTGTINVSLSVPAIVKGADAVLKNNDESETFTIEGSSLTFTDGNATYTATDVSAGNYVLVFTLWGDTEKTLRLGEWREYVGVSKGFASASSPSISANDGLESIYTMATNLDGGLLAGTMPGSYTRYSEEITLPLADKVTKIGYKFAGWKNASGEVVTKIAKGTTGDITLTGTWTTICYEITYNLDGGTNASANPATYTIESEAITLVDASKTAFRFDGWFDAETDGTKVETIAAGSTGAKTLYAHWTALFTALSVTGMPTKTLYFADEAFDGAGLTVTATYIDGSQKTVTSYTTDLGSTVCNAGKTVTISYTEDGVTRNATVNGTYYIAAADALTPSPVLLQGYTGTLSSGTYYKFGDFPQTISALTDETAYGSEPVYNGWYLASDGYFYEKCAENAYDTGNAYKYSDGTQVALASENSTRWFKVEPLTWRVLNPSESGNKILLSEHILSAIAYYDYSDVNRTIGDETVYPNNYEHSKIRAYLNGLSYEKKESDSAAQATDSTYSGKGFLQTAFTQSAQSLIATTTVDNSAESTNPASNASQWNNGRNDYACGNTSDKIFLLSGKEATTSDYGFAEYDVYGEGNARIRLTTDYAKANFAYQDEDSGCGGWWWLRSPNYDISDFVSVRDVSHMGSANICYTVNDGDGGVVPALSISVGN